MMNRSEAEQAINKVENGSDYEYVGHATVVIGKNKFGWWVTDNGEEVSGLTREEAERIAEEAYNQSNN